MSSRSQRRSDAVDSGALRRVLDGRWAAARDVARTEFAGAAAAPAYGLEREAYRDLINEHMRTIAASGRVHETSGLSGGTPDVGAGITLFEMVSHLDLSLTVKAGVQWGLFGGAVQALGNARHHEKYMKQILDFELPGCFAMTETGHGSDVQSLGTTATYEPETQEFVVHTPHAGARKDYIGNAGRDGRMAAVFAQLITNGESHGVHAVLVPIRDEAGQPCPGVTLEDCGPKAGLNGVDNGRITFDQVRVPRENLLDRYGSVAPDGTYSSPIENQTRRFFTMLGTLIRGRISVAGSAGSATKNALAIAVRYGDVRRQFERPGTGEEVVLLDYLVHQRRLLPALATTYALHFAQATMVEKLHEIATGEVTDERAQRELEARAAGIKALATWHATSTIQTCREACGGAGYLAENILPQLKADTDVFTTFEGDNTVLLQLVAKGLLTDYRDQFGDLDTLGMVRFVAGQVFSNVIERTAARQLVQRLIDAAPGRDEDADLLDRGWHLEMFEWREQHVLEGLARRLRKAAAPGADLFAVFNNAQDHVLRAARVHVDRVVLEAFVAGIDACTDPSVAALLEKVCDLYVLSNIEADRAWFLEHGRLTASRSKAVVAAVNQLCGELRPHAVTMVDGFGIPDEWLGAPIALGAEAQRQDAARQHNAGQFTAETPATEPVAPA
jgi:acyl-CoA oxidase